MPASPIPAEILARVERIERDVLSPVYNLRSDTQWLCQQLRAALQDVRRERQDNNRLRRIIERERSAACGVYEALKKAIGSHRGMAESRGSYEWSDNRYRKEFSRALDHIQTKVEAFERETHARDLSDAALSSPEGASR